MPEYGFVIDHRKCIGCHACTVACKSENDVPLGNFRTWVKYVDKGTFPSVRRHFTVLRCNHCDAAPCVEICPTRALHKRPDAIVDLDRDQCIGCRSCMQACPYDALYLNEDHGVAEKCHYCAHRTEIGLQPACVVVCPVEAIVAGDVTDDASSIATLIREEKTSQRKLEKGTRPRVWYVDALEEALEPGTAREPEIYMWSDRPSEPPPIPPGMEPPSDLVAALDVAHPPAWGWHIWSYLLTKNVAAGVMLLAPFLAPLSAPGGWRRDLAPEIAALAMLAVTTFLLIHDLGRPDRFLKIITRPNWNSWLVKGTWVLMAFGGIVTLGLLGRLLGRDAVADAARWIGLPLAALASGYSAWLFGQCRGRELWIARGLFAHLVLGALVAGGSVALALGFGAPATLTIVVILAAVIDHFAYPRLSPDATAAERHAVALFGADDERARGAILIGTGLLVLGVAGLLASGAGWLAIPGALLVLAGQILHERAWVRSGQALPIS